MSGEPFKLWREFEGFIFRLDAIVQDDGTLSVTCADKSPSEHKFHRSYVDLPAADARRLRDWLRERYPHEEDGK